MLELDSSFPPYRTALSRFQFYESPVKVLLPVGGAKCLAGFRKFIISGIAITLLEVMSLCTGNGSCIIWKSNNITGETSKSLELTCLTGSDADPITSVRTCAQYVHTSCRDGCMRAYSLADII